MRDVHCQNPGPTAEAWGPTRALRPAQSSHWLNHPDTKGQGSLISALGGGKPPRAQSRREKDGERIQEGKWGITLLPGHMVCSWSLGKSDLKIHAMWRMVGPRNCFIIVLSTGPRNEVRYLTQLDSTWDKFTLHSPELGECRPEREPADPQSP